MARLRSSLLALSLVVLPVLALAVEFGRRWEP
jgi:hypothetical protein